MRLEKIISRRAIEHAGFWDVVYEWEDQLVRTLGLDVVDDYHSQNRLLGAIRGRSEFLARWMKPSCGTFVFEMWVDRDPGNNKKNIVPLQIDFWLRDKKEIDLFFLARSRNPIVLISSKEVYAWLRSLNVDYPIRHCALSIPDKWISEEIDRYEKKFDLVSIGRTGPILQSYMDRYIQDNPQVRWGKRCSVEGRMCLVGRDGDVLADLSTREQYQHALKAARVVLYTTPSQDIATDASYTHGYNQVTPRLLEYLASGCHVLGRYPINPDTEYYELPTIVPNIETYEEFRDRVNLAIQRPIDRGLYLPYLAKHMTSTRAREIEAVIRSI